MSPVRRFERRTIPSLVGLFAIVGLAVPSAGVQALTARSAAATPESLFVDAAWHDGDDGPVQFGGTQTAYGNRITVDVAGNVVTAGQFSGTTDFDPGPAALDLTSAGSSDAYLAKLDSSSGLVWAARFGAAGADAGWGLATDAGGNVHLSGYFAGSVDFDPGPGELTLTSAGDADGFLVTLDPDGSFIRAARFGGTGTDSARSIALDSDGNIYLAGYFHGTVDFDPGDGVSNLTSSGGRDGFVVKLDPAGALLWAINVGSAHATLEDEVVNLAVDGAGNVLVTGNFFTTADFDPGPGTFELASNAGSSDAFVLKLDADGNFMWAGALGGPSSDEGRDIAVDATGNAYVGGWFRGTGDFDPGPGTLEFTCTSGIPANANGYLVALDPGGSLIWARHLASDANLGVYEIDGDVDGSGLLSATGWFSGTADFDPGPDTFDMTASGSNDGFLWQLDGAGNFVAATTVSGPGNDNGRAVAFGSDGDAYWTGFFEQTADFDPGTPLVELTSYGNEDAFVALQPGSAAPDPTFEVRPPFEVWGNGEAWPVDAPIDLIISTDADLEHTTLFTTSTVVESWGSNGPWQQGFQIHLQDGFHVEPGQEPFVIQPGQLVTIMSDYDPSSPGPEIHKDLVVADLTIAADESTLTLMGSVSAPDGTPVNVNTGNGWRNALVTNGAWSADFGTAPAPDMGDGVLTVFGGNAWLDAQVWDDDGDSSHAGFASPYIHVSPFNGYVFGDNWSAAQPVDVTVNGIAVEPAPIPGESGHLEFELATAPGDEVIATQNGWIAQAIVQALEITAVNEPSDGVVSGIAPDGALVDVHAWNEQGFASRTGTATGGTFSVDFSTPGNPDDWGPSPVTLGPGTQLRAHIYNDRYLPDHDATHHDFFLPGVYDAFMHVIFSHGGTNVLAVGWPEGEQLHLTIERADEFGDPQVVFEKDAVVDQPDDQGNISQAWFDPEFTIERRDIVTISGGDYTTTHQVTDITFDAVDADDDIVSGSGAWHDPVCVDIWMWPDDPASACASPDESGNWAIDFSGIYSLDTNTVMGVFDRDEGGATQVDWRAPIVPWFSVQTPYQVWGNGEEWPVGAPVDLTVSVLSDPEWATIHTASTTVGAWGPNPWDQGFNFNLGDVPEGDTPFEIEPGQLVTITSDYDPANPGPEIHKELVVSNLDDISVDESALTISGSTDAPESSTVNVSIGQAWRDALVSGGSWSANFGTPSETGMGDGILTLFGGNAGGSAQVADNDGDYTFIGLNPPSIHVSPYNDHMFGGDWAPGTVTVTINDEPVLPAPVVDEWGGLNLDLAIEPHDDVVVTQNGWIAEVTVADLEITAVDEAGVVSGRAPDGALVDVTAWTNDGSYANRIFTVSGGSFTVDLSIPGENGEGTVMIGPGSQVRAHIYNDLDLPDYDATIHDYFVPLEPQISVWMGLRLDANGQMVEGTNWPEGQQVTVEIDDPDTTGSSDPDYQNEATPNGDGYVEFYPNEDEFVIEPGFTVTMSDGTTTRSHVVTRVVATATDPEADLVHGAAEPGSKVIVGIWGPFPYREVYAGADEDDGVLDQLGPWTADFSIPQGDQPAIDLVEDPGCPIPAPAPCAPFVGEAWQADDDGDMTRSQWWVPGGGGGGPFNSFDEGDVIISSTDGRLLVYHQDGNISEYGLPFGGNFDIQYLDQGTLLMAAQEQGVMALDLATGNVFGVVGDPELQAIALAIDHENERVFISDEDSGVWLYDWNNGDWGNGTLSLLVDEVPDREAGTIPASADALAYDRDWDDEPNPLIVHGLVYFANAGTPIYRFDPDAPDPRATVEMFVDNPDGRPFNGMVFNNYLDLTVAAGTSVMIFGGYGDLVVDIPLPGAHSVEDVAVLPCTTCTDTGPISDMYAIDSGFVTEFGDDPALYFIDDGPGHNIGQLQMPLVYEVYRGAPLGDVVDLLIAQQPPQPPGPAEPIVQAYVTEEFFRGEGFTPDSSATVSLYDTDGTTPLIDHQGIGTDGDGTFWYGDPGIEQGLLPGMVLEVTDDASGITKTLQLVDVRFDSFDPDTDVVTGFAPQRPLAGEIRLHLTDQDGNPLDDGTGYPMALFPAIDTWSFDLNDHAATSPDYPDYDPSGLLEARVEVPDEDGDGTFGQLPQVRGSAQFGYVNSDHFDSDPLVEVEVYRDDDVSPVQVFTLGPVETSQRGEFHVDSEVGLQPDDVIVVTGLTTGVVKSLVIGEITLDGFDIDNDVISGSAPPLTTIEVNVGNEWCGSGMRVLADGAGAWVADFSTQPGCGPESFDITDDMGAQAMLLDPDMDATVAEWFVPEPPWFQVAREHDFLQGHNWINGPVTVTVDDDDIPGGALYTTTVDEIDPGGYFRLDLQGEFDIQAGQFVTLGDGVATRTLRVTALTVNTVDPTADTVSGVAEPFATVHVETDGTLIGDLTADQNGNWTADASGLIDIRPGQAGWASENDEDGDQTQVEWRLPGDPEFGVTATHDWVEGTDFAGDTITVAFDDDDDPLNGVLHEETFGIDPATYNWLHVIDGFDIEVGQFVTVTDGTTMKSTWVSPIEITDVDRANWIVSGVADPGVEIDIFAVHPDFAGFGGHMVQVGPDRGDGLGEWTLDLADLIDENERPVEIPDGTLIGGGQADVDGDRTVMFWDPALIEGRVLANGVPVTGAEVFVVNTVGPQYTCTDADGYFAIAASVVLSLVRPGLVATGRAVSPEAGCTNADFLDADGIPLLTGFAWGPIDLQDGYEFIQFDVEPAAAIQTVFVDRFTSDPTQCPAGRWVCWVPQNTMMVQAFDLNDADFQAQFGSMPTSDQYEAIWNAGTEGLALTVDFTGVYLLSPDGTVELRYPAASDHLVMIRYFDAELLDYVYLAQISQVTDFADRGDGVLVGPQLHFRLWDEISEPDQQAEAALELLVGLGSTDNRVTKAIEELEEALDPTYWVDDHTLADRGDKVFKGFSKAVRELDKVDDPTPEIEAAIASLVDAARTLAQVQVGLALDLYPTLTGMQQKQVDKAVEDVQKGAQEEGNDHYDKAIDHYGNAWSKTYDVLNS